MIHGIRQDKIAADEGTSTAIVSMVARRKRGGTKKHGPKIERVRKAIANKLGIPIKELFPDKAA
ncbi:MAG: hypothetical protein ABFD25_20485 [Clostridiaceae bacterium]